jgi:hypothetical protein
MTTRVWAIADTHLSFGKPKDMSRFGERWHNHSERIAEAWRAHVAAEDVVVLPGDISWATTTARILPDLAWLLTLPGRKVLVRGNHDHWWKDGETARKIAEPLGFHILEGDSLTFDGVTLCGAMGHLAPHDPYYVADPKKDRYTRELDRLRAALAHAAANKSADGAVIAAVHYPPFTSQGQPTAYVEALSEAQPALCVYGHLHNEAEWQLACNGVYEGVQYRLVAADYIEMVPQLVWPLPAA